MLQLKNITKTYPNSERVILENLSFEIEQGDSIAIVGPSGVGKSTLLNIMGTLDIASSGDVLYKDQDLNKLSLDEQAGFRSTNMGFVFQQHHLLPHLNLVENVLVPTLPINDKKYRKEAKGRALELIDKLGLSALIRQRPGQMSVGECQRTAVVRALINQPDILFADEPTGSLDEQSAHELMDLLVDLNLKQELTLVMVTHSMTMANKLKHRFTLQNGQLVTI